MSVYYSSERGQQYAIRVHPMSDIEYKLNQSKTFNQKFAIIITRADIIANLCVN